LTSSRQALREFDQALAAIGERGTTHALGLGGEEDVNFSLLSEKRASAFRKLGAVSPRGAIELSTIRETAMYTADQTEIVRPDDVSVLRPRAVPSLTLLTRYPFYFAGDAPKRFILHASLTNGSPQREPDYSTTRRQEK